MKNTASPNPNWPSSRPIKDNILEPAKQKAMSVANQIYAADLIAFTACGSLLSAADLSTGTKPKIVMVVASGRISIQAFHINAARYISAGTRKRNIKFHNLFVVSQDGCLVATCSLAKCLSEVGSFVKSSIAAAYNYQFKIYSYIVSKPPLFFKQIMAFSTVTLGVWCSSAHVVTQGYFATENKYNTAFFNKEEDSNE